MNEAHLNEHQIVSLVNEIYTDMDIDAICEKYGIKYDTYDMLKSLQKNTMQSIMQKYSAIEKSNEVLSREFKRLSVDNRILQESLEGKL